MSKKDPEIYFFNPTCEYAIANGRDSWHPNKILQKMEADLSTIPLFFAKEKDVVLVDSLPSEEFLQSLHNLNIAIPRFIVKEKARVSLKFIQQNKNRLQPWGWSPAAHKILSPFKENCSDEFKKSPVFNWTDKSRDLYSKKFAIRILKNIIQYFPSEHFIEEEYLTKVCKTKSEFEHLLKRWGKIMIKAPWSSSGRGLQPITKTPVHPKVWDKLLGIVKEQGYTIVEPYLKKVLDVAFLFELKKGKVTFLGISNFLTDQKGQYIGNKLNGLPETINKEFFDFASQLPNIIVQPLINYIEKSELAMRYEGIFGVDSLVYLDEKNKLRVNPCLEINVRHNMGLLSLYLEKLLHEGKKGEFRMYFNPEKNFQQFSHEMKSKYPLKLVENKINSGFFALIEAKKNTQFGAYLLV